MLFRAPFGTSRSWAMPSGLMALVDRLERQCLIGDPVQRVEGDDEVEFVLEGQLAGIRDRELQVGMGRNPVILGEGDHLGGGIDASDRALGNPRGNFSGGLPIAAADIENAFAPLEFEQREHLFRHGGLKGGEAVVFRGVPFRQGQSFAGNACGQILTE